MKQPTRRDCLVKAGGLAGLLFGPTGWAAESSGKYPRNLTKADIDRLMTELSNWGRWGKDDQAGTINLITPAKRKQASALVKDGVSVSMSVEADIPARGITAAPAVGGEPKRLRYTWEHIMRSNGLGRKDGFVIDSYSVSFHGSATTHLDALSHLISDGKIYNGFPGDSIDSWGATKNDVLPFKNGILRGACWSTCLR
jgi:hypothetical protein